MKLVFPHFTWMDFLFFRLINVGVILFFAWSDRGISQTAGISPAPQGYELAVAAEFNDPREEFNASENPWFTTGNFRLNGKGDWNVTRRLATNGELQIYLDRDAQIDGRRVGGDPFSVSNGVLRITAAPLNPKQKEILEAAMGRTGPPILYSSGMLSTETDGRKGKGYSQLYGYWELRAKLPKGKGLWPAFWLVTETHDYWDEVDIFEVLGHEPLAVHHNTHFHNGGGTDGWEAEKKISRTVDTSDGFHVYGMEIVPGELIYRIDGKEVLRVPHTLEKPLYTIINLAVGGDWPGAPNEETVFPASLEIDYLRIYRKKSSQ